VPHLADYFKEDHVGSLAPARVAKTKNGTMIKWEIPQLEPFEERIITYKIRTQLNILGGLHLPKVTGRFKSDKGRNRITKSQTFKMRHK